MIEAIKRGDAFAYEQAFVQYRDKVYFYFLKKTRSSEDAKDLLQITFLKLWKYRNSLSEDYLLEQHLFQIARTVFIDYLRRENKVVKVRKAVNERFEENNSVYTATEFDLQKHVHKALSSMPALRKKVFELNRLQGYSYKEIAEMLFISVKAVDNNLSKALRQLRKIFLLLVVILSNIF
jgi:RNA polymerase sigma-70 factor (ECF subfamily)